MYETNVQVEREWRRKELEDETKKIKINNELKEARRQKIEKDREAALGEQLLNSEEFDKILRFKIEDRKKIEEIEKQTKIVHIFN